MPLFLRSVFDKNKLNTLLSRLSNTSYYPPLPIMNKSCICRVPGLDLCQSYLFACEFAVMVWRRLQSREPAAASQTCPCPYSNDYTSTEWGTHSFIWPNREAFGRWYNIQTLSCSVKSETAFEDAFWHERDSEVCTYRDVTCFGWVCRQKLHHNDCFHIVNHRF